MELSSPALAKSKNENTSLFLLLLEAIRFRKLQIPSMTRNFILFFVNTIWARANPLFGSRLQFGKNVRIQRFRTLQLSGKHSSIALGDHSIIYEKALLEAVGNGRIEIGECGIIGDCRISARACVSLGKRVLVSWNVFIQDYDSHPLEPEIRAEQIKRMCRRFYPKFSRSNLTEDPSILAHWKPASAPIHIGDDVWLGAGVTILKGVQIGDGCTVASGSVVTAGRYPPRSVLAGNPAKVVKIIDRDEART